MSSVTIESDSETHNAEPESVFSFVATWILVIPLLFFACRGILWFQALGGNSLASTGFGSIAGAKGANTALVLIVVFLCVLALIMTKALSILHFSRKNALFVTLALYAVSSSLWSQIPEQSLQFGIYMVLDVLLVYYIYIKFKPSGIIRLFYGLGWIVVASSVIFSVALPQYGVDHRASTSGSWQGIFVFKNTCAIMATFLLSAAFYVPVQTPRDKTFRAAFVILTLFLIAMTGARTGWIVLIALLIYVVLTKVLSYFSAGDQPAVFLLITIGVLITLVVGVIYSGQILLLLGKDATLTGRTGIWQLVITSAMKRPLLGYGYRAFWNGLHGESVNISLAEQWTVPGAHNGLLESWLDIGLIGLSFVLITFVKAILNGVLCLRCSETQAVKWYVSIIVMTVIANLAEMTIMFPNYLTWMMYVLACVGLADEAQLIRRRQWNVG